MADLIDRAGVIASPIPAMPIHAAAQPAGWIFLIGTILILVAILGWWAIGAERRERGWVLPLVFAGTALSAMMIEPIFDNTLLYWYPPVNELAFFRGFERTLPWYVPLGYAWFFGGTAYLLARRFERGVMPATLWRLFAGVVFIDWLAVSICEWLNLSAFYGQQPFHLFGSPLWFSFCDATGAFVLAGALHMMLPHLSGARRLWLLIVPLFTYGATLGSTTAPVSMALNSGWSTLATWISGAATMALCMIAVHGVGLVAGRPR